MSGIPPNGMNSEVASTTNPSGSTRTTNDPTTTSNADYAANVPPETLANRHPKPGLKLTMQSINVCGLKGKLEIKEFRETLERHDISLLSETKLDNADIDNVKDTISNLKLKAFFKNRKTLTAWRSGGLCILYNVNIEKHITHVISNCKLVQWLKISKVFIGTDKDVMIGNTYVPPERTRYLSKICRGRY